MSLQRLLFFQGLKKHSLCLLGNPHPFFPFFLLCNKSLTFQTKLWFNHCHSSPAEQSQIYYSSSITKHNVARHVECSSRFQTLQVCTFFSGEASWDGSQNAFWDLPRGSQGPHRWHSLCESKKRSGKFISSWVFSFLFFSLFITTIYEVLALLGLFNVSSVECCSFVGFVCSVGG